MMANFKLTPLKLELLLHVYAKPIPFQHPPNIAYADAKAEMVLLGLIADCEEARCGYELTPKGLAYIKLLLTTPIPEQATIWIDPRTKEKIDG